MSRLHATPGTHGVIAAFGIVDRAPTEVSDALRRLNLSHTMTWREGVSNRVQHIDGLVAEQPVWPVVVDSVKMLGRMSASGRYVYLVTDSRAALANTNLGTWLWPENRPHETFTESVGTVLMESIKGDSPTDWILRVKEPSLMDYVNTAVRPSQLNDFQTLVCKINPYPLRKEVQAMCIGYLAGTVSPSALKAKLDSSYKLAPLLELMKEERTKELKQAVARVKAGEPIELVCKATDFQSFEIMYLIKASAIHSVPQPKKKARP